MQVFHEKQNAFQTAKRMLKADGFFGFWRGTGLVVAGCIPAHAAYFTVYEVSKAKLLPKYHDHKDDIYPYLYGLTGGLATLIHDSIVAPFDSKFLKEAHNKALKQRKQIAPSGEKSTLRHLLLHLLRYEGSASLFRGLPASLVNNTIYFIYKEGYEHSSSCNDCNSERNP